MIIGGGFAGLNVARGLRRAPVSITLIDRRNFHLFQPLLYQVATGGLSPADIASPLRGILARQKNIRVLQGAATGIDVDASTVLVGEESIDFDYLIVATGAKHHYFGNDDWETRAPGLKTVEDALKIRKQVLSTFEKAEAESDPNRRDSLLTFVVVGGGPTGVELAGALGELANHTLRHDFRVIDPTQSKIVLVEGTDRLLPTYAASSSQRAVDSLTKLGVTVLTNTRVTDVGDRFVTLRQDGKDKQILTNTVLWGAGVKASSFSLELAEATGASRDKEGRIVVSPDLSVPGHPDVFVLGDLANFEQDGRPLPGVAPVAMQQGAYVAQLLRARLRDKSLRQFRYRDYGNMAVIGRAAAVAEIGKLRFHGFWAWLMWLFIHLINLVEYKSRVLVLIQWGWSYFTRNRSARLITFDDLSHDDRTQTQIAEHSPTISRPEKIAS